MEKDIFGTKIEAGNIVCYASRVGSRQILNFAIVLRIIEDTTSVRNITIRALETNGLEGKLYRFRDPSNVSPSGLWVLRDYTNIPAAMLKKLESGFQLFLSRQRTKAEKEIELAEGRKMTPGERYRNNLKNMMGDQSFAEMQQDILSA